MSCGSETKTACSSSIRRPILPRSLNVGTITTTRMVDMGAAYCREVTPTWYQNASVDLPGSRRLAQRVRNPTQANSLFCSGRAMGTALESAISHAGSLDDAGVTFCGGGRSGRRLGAV